MSNEVVLVGRAELDAIFQSLKKVTDQSQAAMKEMGNLGQQTNETLQNTGRKTENGLKKTGTMLRQLASRLYSDFKGLISLQSTLAGLKLSSQFSGSVKESIKLSDSVRRLGNSFGVAKSEFGFFQASLAKGLGDIGASSEAASQALEGMAGFGVKGVDSVTGLAKGAVTLAGIGGERGREKEISHLLASVLQQSGKDVNDLGAQKKVIGEVTAAVTATGKSASEILGAMDAIFSKMPDNLRKSVGPEAMAQLATLTTTGGPGVAQAFQDYLGKDEIGRMAMEAQGFQPFKDGKLDLAGIQRFIEATKARGPGARTSLQTAGFSEEAAEGLVRLGEKASLVQENLNKLANATRDNEKAFKSTMGLVDAFKGSINTLKGYFEAATMGGTQKVTDLLSGAVGDPLASGAVVGGAGLLAAILTGGGLKGLGGTLASGVKEKAIESATGEDVQKVNVINWPAALSVPGAVASGQGAIGKLGQGAAALGVGATAYALTDAIVNPALDKYTQGTTDEGFTGNAVERFFAKLDAWSGGSISGTKPVQIKVETKEPGLRVKSGPTRGTAN